MKIRMEQERINRGWNVTDIAEQVGLTLSAVSKILNGHNKPSYRVLVKLENLFKMSHKDLLEKQIDEPTKGTSKDSIT